MRLAALAPAKINRELRVGRVRPDGYHEILSRMVSIDLADGMTVEEASGLTLECDDPRVPVGDANIIVKAARALAAEAGVAPRARILLTKKVPMGGGLGGGSADAAIALRLLAALWRADVREDRLSDIAAGLGSDVPFFLQGGQADASGRGERITPVEDGPRAELLLLVPPFPVPTGPVYAAYRGRGRLPERLDVSDPGREKYLGRNDLAPAVLEVEGRMESYLRAAADLTPDYAISGSGATIVLHGAGAGAPDSLSVLHPEAQVHRCRTLTRDEYTDRTRPREEP